MATCFRCKSKGGLELYNTGRLYAKAPGTYSLAGVQVKVPAMEVLELRHPACGWSVQGTVENGYLVPLPDWEPQQDLQRWQGGPDDGTTG